MLLRKEKEKSLLERVLAKEEVDLNRFSMNEIKKVIDDLVELQVNRVRRDEILKLQEVIDKASAKIREILNSEK